MPRTCLDTVEAIELAETLQLIARWLAADPERLAASLLEFIGHPAYGPDALRADLDRLAFLLGGNDGEFLLGEDPGLPGTRGQSHLLQPVAGRAQDSVPREATESSTYP